MFKKLSEIYKENFSTKYSDNPQFQYFITDEGEIFGINKNVLTKKEFEILSLFYNHYSPPLNQKTNTYSWYEFLFNNGEIPTIKDKTSMRCIYFFLQNPLDSQKDFEEAISGLIEEPIICWFDYQSGLIVYTSEHLTISENDWEQWINSFTTDLLINIQLFIGQLHHINNSGVKKIHREMRLINETRSSLPSHVLKTVYQLQFDYLLKSNHQVIQDLSSDKLLDSLSDVELRKTLKVLIENHLNLSLTAKEMYIHRNSLQYRLDKFSTNTGIQLKDFSQVSFVYWLIKAMGN
ncbi:helix-turn-helix domain-containing protein [Bacillus carboniphilus]|uniref:Helix-turn-helix domain-containing protein n=1 Tax=Bacillus carboniphilus TaxID=86663 RepID=A0ABY9JWX1_9BACI|nr:helix-turn-helix domain-containing protein [Bacillus carboniphilus]WLR42798.1 helix-turn-helix domain-containing protein [Bacillus carboniphilus]